MSGRHLDKGIHLQHMIIINITEKCGIHSLFLEEKVKQDLCLKKNPSFNFNILLDSVLGAIKLKKR